MDKPHIKFDITHIEHHRINRNGPVKLINAYYRYKDKQWNAPEYMTIKAYNNPKKRFHIFSLLIEACCKRFKTELND